MKPSSLLWIFSIFLFFPTISLQAQEGIVFLDQNENGIQDPGEKGIADVVISDGYSLTRTDGQGRFMLELASKAHFITAYTPSGYRHTTSYYHDIRSNSSGTVQFGLFPAEDQTGTFLHLSDIEERAYLDWMDDFKDYIHKHPFDFVAVTGDICYQEGLILNGTQFNSRETGVRMVYTLGNHDLIKGYQDKDGRPYGEKLYEDYFGPCWYAFNSNGIHFVVTPMLSGDAKPSYTAEEVYAWMQADLNTLPHGTPVVIFNHGLLTLDFPEHNIIGYIYGHNHINYHTIQAGIPYFCSIAPNKGGNDHSPSSWRIFSYQDGKLYNRLHYYPIPKHIAAQGDLQGDTLHISAVVYDGKSDVKEVMLLDGNNTYSLAPTSPFHWEVSIPYGKTDTPLLPVEKAISTLQLRALFSDGDVRHEAVKFQPGIVWRQQFQGQGSMGSPIICGDYLYVPLADDQMSRHCGVLALDKNSGETRWFFPTSGSVRNEMVLEDGRLFVSDVNSELYALDPTDGRLLWQYRFRDQGLYPSNTQGICYSQGKLYIGQGSQLTALHAHDGSVCWKNPNDTPSGITDVSTYVVADGVLCVNAYWVGRYGLDAETGALLWEKRDAQHRYSTGTPVMHEGKLYYTVFQSLVEMDPRTGTIYQQVRQEHIFNTRSRISIQDSIAVVGTSNHGMTGYRLKDFSQLWNTTTMPALIYTSPYTKSYEMSVETDPVPYGNNLIFGANDGYLYCITRDRGAYVWRHEIGLPILANPVIDGDYLYVLDLGGRLTKLCLTTIGAPVHHNTSDKHTPR